MTGLGNNSLGMTPKAQLREKNKQDFIKIKTFLYFKGHYEESKKIAPQNGRKCLQIMSLIRYPVHKVP